MKVVAKDYTERLGLFQAKQPQIPFYSSVTEQLNPDLSTSYWVLNLISPVLFKSAAASALQSQDNATFVEVGPHSALQGPIRQNIQGAGKSADYIATLVRDMDASQALLSTAGNLWLNGITVDFHAVNGSPKAVKLLTNLPTYSWQYDGEYWLENRPKS
jgi:acyl transferase domain-containing protein